MATSGRKPTTRLTNDALAFLTERHLAMLTTLRNDNSPHVVAVESILDTRHRVLVDPSRTRRDSHHDM